MARRLPVVISPLMRIEPTGDVPDFDKYKTIILTSGNGVQRLGPALADRHVATVGRRTAELAREQGADASALGENVEEFLTAASDLISPALFCRGVHSRGDLANRLTDMGHSVDEAVLYEQVSVPLSNAARMLLTGDAPVVLPVFSPRTAKLLSSNRITAPTVVLAISSATASAWNASGKMHIAESPDAKAMRALVTRTLS